MLSRSSSFSLLFALSISATFSTAEKLPIPNELTKVTIASEKSVVEENTEPKDESSLEQPLPAQPKTSEPSESVGEQKPLGSSDTNKSISDTLTATSAPEEAAVTSSIDDVKQQQLGKEVDSTPSKEEKSLTTNSAKGLYLLGTEVLPATSVRLAWSPSQHFEGVYSATPVLVVNGAEPGPTLCLTAAIHGDELNGIETVRKVVYNLDPKTLQGAVIGVPIVNLQGFHRGSRYLTDRRDLNRHFPGDANGSSAARIARSFFDEIVTHCDAIVDLHTGSFYRTNLPQLRGDLRNSKVVKMTKGFGSTVVLHSKGANGTLRRSAVDAGIPAVTLEAGAPMVLDEKSVNHSVKGIRTLLNQLDMVSKFRLWGDPEPVYYNSIWQRATTGGIIFSDVSLGQNVRVGDLLGTVTNPITNVRKEIRSQYNGRVLGMAMNQVVQPGFAAYHIGIQAPEEQISRPAQVTAGSEAGISSVRQKNLTQISEPTEDVTTKAPTPSATDSQNLLEQNTKNKLTELPQGNEKRKD